MLTMEAWRIKIWSRRGSVDKWLQIRITRTRIRIEVKRWIRIRIPVMRIRNIRRNNKLL